MDLQEELKILNKLHHTERGVNSNNKDEKKVEKEEKGEQRLVLREEKPSTIVPFTAASRQLQTMNDAGELVLTDGSTIGHRSMWRYYRQHVRPVETREHVVVSQLAQKYQTLQLQTYRKQQRFNTVKPHWSQRRENKMWMKLGTGAGNANMLQRYRERNAIII